ncbi:MAG: polyprenyl synthetase family protein [Candidatus Rokubacteria bacterium]|nr:polyprenyl synthetase family protein [Candidatus Rokubacteria bacterium]
MSAFDLPAYLTERRGLVDAALERFLPPDDTPPPTVHRAMRYSVMAGGKRLRPILVIAGAEAVGGTPGTVLPAACALELIHTYSLIHDDLPAMDDDDYRRGRLTNHKVFGEAIAILAGDALLTLAFRLVTDTTARVNDARVLRDVVVELADAAGTFGMVGGQVVDIESEGKAITAETLEYIHRHKTAALIRASLRVGALLAGGDAKAVAAIGEAGSDLGLAFQIVDDILDVEGSLEELGKTAGSDARKQKATYPALHGLEASRRQARMLIERVKQRVDVFGARAVPLRALADYVLERKS